MQVTNNTILITGGGSGIGLELVRKFVKLNNQMIIIGRNEEKLAEVKKMFPHVVTYRCDLNAKSDVDQFVQLLYEKHPNLNMLINNAGIQYNYNFNDEADQQKVIEDEITINFTTPVILINKLLPLLKKQPYSAIVNISSGLGLTPKQSAPVYCGTKAAIHIFTKALRYQLEQTTVQVFEVIPPIVDTNMTKGRGTNKMEPKVLVNECIASIKKDKHEIAIGKVKGLKLLLRLVPKTAANMLRGH